MVVVNILAPIILLIALGATLRLRGFATEAFFRETNRLVYWIGLPFLLFQKTATARPQLGEAVSILLVLLAITAACVGLGYLVGWCLRLDRSTLASFVQGAYRGNLAYVGLPVVLYALAALGQDSPDMEALALLSIAPVIPVYNVVAVLVLLGSQQGGSVSYRQQGIQLARGVATNPLVIACVGGVAYAYAAPPLPLAIDRTLIVVGQMALPLALLGIGATLRAQAIKEGGTAAFLAALIKVAIAPLAGWALAQLVGLSGAELQITLLYLAMPTAAMSYVMAERLGADSRLAGSIVVISTLLAVPVLVFVIAWV